jgi:hypothetical protein
MAKVTAMDSGECVIGSAVTTQRHGAGVVRFVYDTPAGPHAVVKFGGNLMRVMPLKLLTAAPSPDREATAPPKLA